MTAALLAASVSSADATTKTRAPSPDPPLPPLAAAEPFQFVEVFQARRQAHHAWLVRRWHHRQAAKRAAAAAVAAAQAAPPAPSPAPASPPASGSSPPSWWVADALCVHSHEGAWTDNTGNGYYGGLQFSLSTWQGAGGVGLPNEASPSTQLAIAYHLWQSAGWSPWPNTARMCGLL